MLHGVVSLSDSFFAMLSFEPPAATAKEITEPVKNAE